MSSIINDTKNEVKELIDYVNEKNFQDKKIINDYLNKLLKDINHRVYPFCSMEVLKNIFNIIEREPACHAKYIFNEKLSVARTLYNLNINYYVSEEELKNYYNEFNIILNHFLTFRDICENNFHQYTVIVNNIYNLYSNKQLAKILIDYIFNNYEKNKIKIDQFQALYFVNIQNYATEIKKYYADEVTYHNTLKQYIDELSSIFDNYHRDKYNDEIKIFTYKKIAIDKKQAGIYDIDEDEINNLDFKVNSLNKNLSIYSNRIDSIIKKHEELENSTKQLKSEIEQKQNDCIQNLHNMEKEILNNIKELIKKEVNINSEHQNTIDSNNKLDLEKIIPAITDDDIKNNIDNENKFIKKGASLYKSMKKTNQDFCADVKDLCDDLCIRTVSESLEATLAYFYINNCWDALKRIFIYNEDFRLYVDLDSYELTYIDAETLAHTNKLEQEMILFVLKNCGKIDYFNDALKNYKKYAVDLYQMNQDLLINYIKLEILEEYAKMFENPNLNCYMPNRIEELTHKMQLINPRFALKIDRSDWFNLQTINILGEEYIAGAGEAIQLTISFFYQNNLLSLLKELIEINNNFILIYSNTISLNLLKKINRKFLANAHLLTQSVLLDKTNNLDISYLNKIIEKYDEELNCYIYVANKLDRRYQKSEYLPELIKQIKNKNYEEYIEKGKEKIGLKLLNDNFRREIYFKFKEKFDKEIFNKNEEIIENTLFNEYTIEVLKKDYLNKIINITKVLAYLYQYKASNEIKDIYYAYINKLTTIQTFEKYDLIEHLKEILDINRNFILLRSFSKETLEKINKRFLANDQENFKELIDNIYKFESFYLSNGTIDYINNIIKCNKYVLRYSCNYESEKPYMIINKKSIENFTVNINKIIDEHDDIKTQRLINLLKCINPNFNIDVKKHPSFTLETILCLGTDYMANIDEKQAYTIDYFYKNNLMLKLKTILHINPKFSFYFVRIVSFNKIIISMEDFLKDTELSVDLHLDKEEENMFCNICSSDNGNFLPNSTYEEQAMVIKFNQLLKNDNDCGCYFHKMLERGYKDYLLDLFIHNPSKFEKYVKEKTIEYHGEKYLKKENIFTKKLYLPWQKKD